MSVWGITVLFFCLFVCDFCWDSDRIVPRSVTELCQWKMSDSGPMWSSCGRKLQRKSMSVCGRHWATSAHHAQLWRSGVQSFSKEIWRWKMRDDLDLYQSPPEIVDHVYDLILADQRISKEHIWIILREHLGMYKLSAKRVLRNEIEWTYSSWFCILIYQVKTFWKDSSLLTKHGYVTMILKQDSLFRSGSRAFSYRMFSDIADPGLGLRLTSESWDLSKGDSGWGQN